MLDLILSTLALPGFIIGTVLAAALLWWLGLRQPFLLVFAALLLGGGVGVWIELRLLRKPRA